MRMKWASTLCWLSLGACAASETGNPVREHSLALVARSSVGDVSLSGGPATQGMTVDAVWVVLGDIRFESSATCDDGDEREADLPGPIIAELVAHPEQLELAIADTTYCRVRVPLERAETLPAGAPAELEDAAIVVQATRGDGTKILVRSRAKREAELRSRDQPFELSRARSSLLLAFDVGRWLEGLDLDGATPDSSGMIRIDDDHERDLLDRFEANVEGTLELFEDANHDGKLNESEDDDAPLANDE